MKPTPGPRPLRSLRCLAAAAFTAVLSILGPRAVPAQATSVARAQPAAAQPVPDTPFERYQARVTTTQNEQPHWITPLVTVTPRLEQEFRTDFLHFYTPSGSPVWNYDNGKGLEFIPEQHTEILLNLPPFFNRSNGQSDGFGDLSFLMKERLYSRNEQNGNSIVTLFFGGSVPTGKNGNGLCCAVVTPTLALGQGRGLWDVSSTLGGSLPVSNARGLGHVITWNSVLQYQIAHNGLGRFFWPELESNDSFFLGAANDGKTSSYLTPGLVLGRIPLMPHATTTAGKRLGLTFGLGEQIAVTRFNPYNHALILTARIPF